MTIYDAIRVVAPEDIRPRTFVFVLAEHREACVWVCTPQEGIAVHPYVLQNTDPEPLCVESIALPYVLATRPDGKAAVLDVRRHRLARVDARFGRKVSRRLNAPSTSPKSNSKSKKKKK